MFELCSPDAPPPLGEAIAPQTLRDWGEHRLLQHLQQFSPATVTGDDAALLPLPSGLSASFPLLQSDAEAAQPALVITTDVLIDGVHFSDRTTPPHAVGWRAVAANLSDLAAMGAVPWGITVGLGLPVTSTVGWVDALYRGMHDCLADFGGAIVGGDLCRSPVATVAITALGWPAVDPVWQRSALQPGDWLVATGWHGASRAGLALLLDPERGNRVPTEQRQAWIQAHQYPCPRGDVVATVRSLRLATGRLATDLVKADLVKADLVDVDLADGDLADGDLANGDLADGDLANGDLAKAGCLDDGAIAAMDTSDGLADAAWQLCQASGVSAVLWGDRLPQPPGLAQWMGAATAEDWTLFGGEDFELLLGLPPHLAAAYLPHLGPNATICGVATPPQSTGPALYLGVIAPSEILAGQPWRGAIDLSSCRILYGAGAPADPRFQHFR
jgi:thiamine-monophosphate kinase